MIRVVLGTNIIVSALLQPLGPPAQVFVLALGGSIQLCVSGIVYTEYEEVIRRPRLKRSSDIVAATLDAIREKAVWVRPTERVQACADPDDDIFLECAQAANADLSRDRESHTLSDDVVRNPHRDAPLAAWTAYWLETRRQGSELGLRGGSGPPPNHIRSGRSSSRGPVAAISPIISKRADVKGTSSIMTPPRWYLIRQPRNWPLRRRNTVAWWRPGSRKNIRITRLSRSGSRAGFTSALFRRRATGLLASVSSIRLQPTSRAGGRFQASSCGIEEWSG
jgi:putative PIN family toxin of toxin-antitoxin system